eukprot:1353473-Amorphochlora_amoeboformis.AAC.1
MLAVAPAWSSSENVKPLGSDWIVPLTPGAQAGIFVSLNGWPGPAEALPTTTTGVDTSKNTQGPPVGPVDAEPITGETKLPKSTCIQVRVRDPERI